jgi:hypothetical protein
MINLMVFDGMILMWFILTALSVLFVAVDIRNTPEDPVLKWGFILLTAYIGPFGVFLYVLGCREPLPGLHEQYISARWRQVLGSTMHCVAGDGIGILAGAVIGALIHISMPAEMALEYILGFLFGWTIFQALAMKAMLGTYKEALVKTFYSELVSMNWLMAGMMPTMMISMRLIEGAGDPMSPRFWFIMSMSLFVGFINAYPINWWLVSRQLKHGMMTVRPHQGMSDNSGMSKMAHGSGLDEVSGDMSGMADKIMDHSANSQETAVTRHENHQVESSQPSNALLATVLGISFVALFLGITVGGMVRSALGS